MAYEFKKLSDVNVIESISDTLNVLVEDNGEVVKIAANNLVPEDVVTQSEMEEAIAAIPEPVTSWHDLQDRPFGEEKTVIEWDGVIGDRATFSMQSVMNFVRVADYASVENLTAMEARMITDGQEQHLTLQTQTDSGEPGVIVIIESGGAMIAVAVSDEAINGEIGPQLGITESGLYVYYGNDADGNILAYISSITFEDITKIPSKYTGVYIAESDGSVLLSDYDELVAAIMRLDKVFLKIGNNEMLAEYIRSYQIGSADKGFIFRYDDVIYTQGGGEPDRNFRSQEYYVRVLPDKTLEHRYRQSLWLATDYNSNPTKGVVLSADEYGRLYFGPTLQPKKAVANGDTEIVLTSPSGKQFAITVSNDGTLTATEVTE